MKRFSLEKVMSRARSLALRRKTTTIYVPVDDHIYFDGLSYRVRVTRDKQRTSKNFSRMTQAIKYKKKLLRDGA